MLFSRDLHGMYCTNTINLSRLVTCDRRDEILVSSHRWGRCDHQKNSSKCQNVGGRHRVSLLFVDSLKYFIEIFNSYVARLRGGKKSISNPTFALT